MTQAPLRRCAWLAGLAAAGLSACAPQTYLGSPENPLTVASFSEPEVIPTARTEAWWTTTDDAVLADVVAASGQVGVVAVAEARLAEAAALARVADAARGLTLGFSLQQSVAIPDPGDAVGASLARIDASLPIDLFDSLGARSAAAVFRVRQSEAELDDVRLRARVSAARLYVAVRTCQAQQTLAAQNIEAAEALLSLAEAREAARLGSGLETAQARTALERARAALPALQLAERQAILALEALLGRSVALPSDASPSPAVPIFPAREFMTLPAALLVDRPDLRAAQAQLAAAGMDTRAAQADRYPSLNLAGALAASDTRFGVSTRTAEVGLGLVGVLFDQGRLAALSAAASAREAAALEAYLQAVRDAFADVETQLESLRRAEESIRLQQALVTAATAELTLARARNAAELVDFSEVLLAQQSRAEAEISLVTAQADRANAALALLLSLGAGAEVREAN